MNRRNFFASLISAVVVKASVELGVLEEMVAPALESPKALSVDGILRREAFRIDEDVRRIWMQRHRDVYLNLAER